MSDTLASLADTLESQIASCQWSDLTDHVARGALILIAPRLDLVEAAVAVAEDRADLVEQWVNAGLISKPTQAQADQFESSSDTVFRFVIVQPLVLAKIRTN